jgi:hypothetical protein
MMTIPFLALAAGLAAIWVGHRNAALVLWGAGIAAILLLFRIHTTSQLGLGL